MTGKNPMLEVSFPVAVFSPNPVIFFFYSKTPFQRTSPPRIAQRVGGVPWHDLGTVIVDVHPRRGAACMSERVAMTRIATIQTDGHDMQQPEIAS